MMHDFMVWYTRILKWIPFVNFCTLIYWGFRSAFVTHKKPTFSMVARAIGMIIVTLLVARGIIWVLLQLALFTTQEEAERIVFQLWLWFAFIPVLVNLEKQKDIHE